VPEYEPRLFIQDVSYRSNVECYRQSFNTQAQGDRFCDKIEYGVWFALNELSRLDVPIYRANRLFEYKQPYYPSEYSLGMSGVLQLSRNQRIETAIPEWNQPTDFQTLFSVAFCTENYVSHTRETWLIQDEDTLGN